MSKVLYLWSYVYEPVVSNIVDAIYAAFYFLSWS
ncbi:MAG: hypothetical protein ACJASB_001026 [Shewanella psychromarinicola]|jgi:hypothetical protein